MKINVELSQKQVLSQQLIQSMQILQMSALELREYVENAAMENPVMDLPDITERSDLPGEDDIQRKLSWLEAVDYQNRIYYNQEKREDFSGDLYSRMQFADTLADYLRSQLLLSDYGPKEWEIMEFIIDSLDSKGYFPEGAPFVAAYFGIPLETAENLLNDMKRLDPAGVAAADLAECLLLQLSRREQANSVAESIVRLYLPELARNHLQDIADKLDVSLEEVRDACEIIKSLNPKPGNAFSDRLQLSYIRPDALVVRVKDCFEILINEYDYPQFTINQYYRELSIQTEDSETRRYLRQKLSQAESLQSCIRQRTSTLSMVLRCIVEKQEDFFLFGLGHRHPLKLRDIAAELKIHESTVSRALKGKYLQCACGIFPLNYFLTAAASTGKSGDKAEEKTPEQINECLRRVIDSENKKKPLSDQAICEALEQYGVFISRRTVNKYRIALGIPDKSGRKNWSP